MIKLTSETDLARLRRLALAAQGLTRAGSFGRGLKGARAAINHIGYVQIDTISVVERAHHHVFSTRVPGFVPSMTNALIEAGDIFEYWAHAAAFLPMTDYRYSLPYKEAIREGKVHWYKTFDRKLMTELLRRIRSEGPLRSRDLESDSGKRGGWWDWKPAKKALEQLYMQGDLTVCGRDGFQKSYDLTERVLPAHVDTTSPTMAEFAEHLVDQQLRCHGLVTMKGFTYLRRNAELRKAVKALVDERMATKQLEAVSVGTGDVFFVYPGTLDQRMPRITPRLQILSPFDNAVIQRERLRGLFGFDYQIECYVPEPKRQFGYFCLPLLYRDAFIGRIDCKVHRKMGELELKAAYFENTIYKDSDVIEAFGEAIGAFREFQGCHSVRLGKVIPARLRSPLSIVCEAHP